jgi:hypothetical protein
MINCQLRSTTLNAYTKDQSTNTKAVQLHYELHHVPLDTKHDNHQIWGF